MSKKNPVGSPTKYKPEYNDLAIQVIGDEGKSIVEFACLLRVDRSTIYRWAERYPEFSNTLSRAKDFSEAYWMGKFPEWMDDRNANAKLIALYMANRFGWKGEGKRDDEKQAPPPSVVVIK